MFKRISENVKALNDKGISFIWDEILKQSNNMLNYKGPNMAFKLFVEMVELNPRVKEVDGMLELCEVLSSRIGSKARSNLNRGKLKRAKIQNDRMERSAESLVEFEKDCLNESINNLKHKTNSRSH